MLPTSIVTTRLSLRQPRSSDASRLFRAYTMDAEVTRYLVWRPHKAITEAEAFIATCIEAWENRTRFPYIITLTSHEQEPIGMVEARPNGHTVDMGYVLARQFWGQGIMREALIELTERCLALPEYYRVQATCDVENLASIRLLEKAGFSREGRLERYALHPNISPEPRACLMYARCR
ncbi:GNAT family N-acetyltransferase [Billgrantia sp. LNSP4103-1]|uniref:GNAT family N-acetyltransferase n=1 Tax=Billgrantia sp. LNSP4103-1 TaxID=3410266 RepID=UPI00403F059F